jgi:hypothetical protein
MVPYWVDQYLSQGVFPSWTFFKSCNEYEVNRFKNFRNGILDISRAHIFSFMGASVEVVLHPHLQCNIFPRPFIFH